MSKKNLAILMRARMRAAANQEPIRQQLLLQPAGPNSPPHQDNVDKNNRTTADRSSSSSLLHELRFHPPLHSPSIPPFDYFLYPFHLRVTLKDVKESIQASISIPAGKLEPVDGNLEDFSQGYLNLDQEGRGELLLAIARDYDVNRARVRDLMRQYLSVEPHGGSADMTRDEESAELEDEGVLAALYRTERNLRDALKPMYAVFFERLNELPGGLKLLAILRADLLSVLV